MNTSTRSHPAVSRSTPCPSRSVPRRAAAILLALLLGAVGAGAQGGPGQALQLDGTNDLVSTSLAVTNPQAFSLGVWFKTGTTRGGRLLGFGDSQTGTSASCDRALYLGDDGRLHFGVHSGGLVQALHATFAYNDGQWHQASATFSTVEGMKLYVDGQLVDANASFNTALAYTGYWRVGGDTLAGWPSAPTSAFLAGQVDEVQIWSRVRSGAEILAEFHRTPAGDESGLSVLLHCDEGAGLTVADAAPAEGANTGTLVNGPAWVTSTAPVGVPTITLGGITSLSLTGVVVTGTVNPNFQATSVAMEYGLTTNYGSQTVAFNVGAAGTSAPVSVTLLGLLPGTKYFHRLTATSAGGAARSAGGSFITLSNTVPGVTTQPYSAATFAGATLNALVNPNNAPTTVWFEYGATTNYGSVSGLTNLVARTTNVPVSLPVTGLAPGTQRYFRVVATNVAGLAAGTPLLMATLTFSNVSVGPPVLDASAAAWGDYDNDGLLDLVVAGNPVPVGDERVTQLWRNLGNGTFTNVGAGLPAITAYHTVPTLAWGDYDNDGWLDLLLGGPTDLYGSGRICQVWRNLANGSFSNINAGLPGFNVGQAAWGDFDADGRLDVVITGSDASVVQSANPITRVWRNTGGGFVLLNSGLPALYNSAVAVGDFDNDGYPDVALTGSDRSEVWRNRGDGTFVFAAGVLGARSGSVGWTDIDNDGWLDLTTSGGYPVIGDYLYYSAVWRNLGNGTFSRFADVTPVTLGDIQGGDYDNDGLTDLALGGNFGSQVWGNRGPHLTNILTSLSFTRGRTAWGDYDNDGRLDLAVGSAVYRHVLAATNTRPLAPSNLVATVSGDGVVLGWAAGADAQTPAAGLSYNFRVGTTPGGSQIVSAQANSVTGERRVPRMGNAHLARNAAVTKLARGVTYYWSVQAVDSAFAGSAFAAESSFYVPFAPAVTTLVATAVGATTATLNGSLNPNIAAATHYFRWGTNSSNLTELSPMLGATGSAVVAVSVPLTGLLPATTYYYQLVAGNAGGTNGGAILAFTTAAAAPSVLTQGPSWLTPSNAWLRGSVASNGLPTAQWFEYGLTTNYGASVPVSGPGAQTGLQLNGVNQYAGAGSFALAQRSFTIELWLRRARTNALDFALFQGSAVNNRGLHLAFRPSGVFTFDFWGNELATPAAYLDTDWHHWACTFDAATRARAIYRDGVRVAADVSPADYIGTGNLNLGYASPVTGSYFAGSLDEVRVWDAVRTPGQIAVGMNVPALGSEPGLLALWQFSEGTGTASADGSGQGHPLSLVNAPAWVPGAPGLWAGQLPASLSQRAVLSNLLPNVVYHYRLVASNALGTTYGQNRFLRPVDLAPVNTPIAVSGFNVDAVIESGGISVPVHDGAYGWFAAGTGGRADGLPMGTALLSEATACGANTVFQLAPANATNALKLGHGFPSTGTLTLAVPAAYASLSVLGASGNGGGLSNLTLHLASGSNYVMTWNPLDWCASCGDRRNSGFVALENLGRNVGLGAPGTGSNYGSGFTYERNSAFGLYETRLDLAAAGLGVDRVMAVSFDQAPAVSSFVFGLSGALLAVPISIAVAPVEGGGCVGGTAAFSVASDHPAITTYQWQRRAPGATNFVDLPGATAASYVTPVLAAADENAAFRVVLAGPLNVVTSAPVLLRVAPLTPAAPAFSADFAVLPTNATLYGSAFLDTTNGSLVLTPPVTGRTGLVVFADPAPGRVVRAFTAAFRGRITPVSPTPADGFSFNWATNLPGDVWGVAEEGLGNGLSVCFDIYNNGGNEAPAVDVKWGGTLVARRLVPSSFLPTGTNFVNVWIRLHADGTLDVFYNCELLYSRLPLPVGAASGLAGARFALAARTGGQTALQAVDDFALEFSSAPLVPLAITRSPQTVGACPGSTATFSVEVNDLPQVTGYQWERRAPGGPGFSPLPGATNAAYATPVLSLADDLTQFRVRVAAAGGGVLTTAVAEVRMPAAGVPTASWNLDGPATNVMLRGVASYYGSGVVLTSGDGTGNCLLGDPAGGALVRGFTAVFQVGTENFGEGGYGFSFNWAPGLSNAVLTETGSGQGLTVRFRTLFASEFNSALIEVFWNGVSLAATGIPYWTDLAQGMFNPGEVMVRLHPNQTLDVFFRCRPLFTALPIPAVPVAGAQFGFAARTAPSYGDVWRLDNVSVSLDIVPAAPARLDQVARLGDGNLRFQFTNAPGALCTVLASTNVTLPAGQWIPLGTATESPSGSGQFQFTDLQATNFPARFYRVRIP